MADKKMWTPDHHRLPRPTNLIIVVSPCVSLSVVVCVISYGWHVGADQIHFHFSFWCFGGAGRVEQRWCLTEGMAWGGGSRSSMVCILTYMVIWPRLLPSSPPPPPPPSLLISMATSWTGTLLWSVPSLPPPFLFSFCLRYDIIIIMRYAILPVWWRR